MSTATKDVETKEENKLSALTKVEKVVSRLQHTKGPWEIYNWAEHMAAAGYPSSVGQSDELGMEAVDVCDFSRNPDIDSEEAWANARLIAAAPELLEALEKIVWHTERNSSPGFGELGSIAASAIAKAKGEVE